MRIATYPFPQTMKHPKSMEQRPYQLTPSIIALQRGMLYMDLEKWP